MKSPIAYWRHYAAIDFHLFYSKDDYPESPIIPAKLVTIEDIVSSYNILRDDFIYTCGKKGYVQLSKVDNHWEISDDV